MKHRTIEISRIVPHEYSLDSAEVFRCRGIEDLWVPVHDVRAERPLLCDRIHRLFAYSGRHEHVTIFQEAEWHFRDQSDALVREVFLEGKRPELFEEAAPSLPHEEYAQSLERAERYGTHCIRDLSGRLLSRSDHEWTREVLLSVELLRQQCGGALPTSELRWWLRKYGCEPAFEAIGKDLRKVL